MEKVKEFLHGVKEGVIRGDYTTYKLRENVFLEVSVADFQYGNVHVRLWVEDEKIEPEEGMNFRKLHKISSEYTDVQQSVQTLLEQENETEVSVFLEPEMKRPSRATDNPDMVPRELQSNSTYGFDQMVQLRDDVSIAEAMMTNREDGMTRTEVEDYIQDQDS